MLLCSKGVDLQQIIPQRATPSQSFIPFMDNYTLIVHNKNGCKLSQVNISHLLSWHVTISMNLTKDIIVTMTANWTVCKIEPILPPMASLKAWGWTDLALSLSQRTGFFSASCQFLNFSNRTIIKGDMAISVKPCQNQKLWSLWAGYLLTGQATLKTYPSHTMGTNFTNIIQCLIVKFSSFT